MGRLSKKLHSERGASLLMALLLLLVCMMVASSILAAAASNAGKARSNRVEQQKYLTLSSAIRLIADEIQKANYTGKYTIYEWENDEGTPEDPDMQYYFYVEQEAGTYSCDQLTDRIPLGDWLDKILSERFTDTGYKPLHTAGTSDPAECTLTVTLPASLDWYPDAEPGLPSAYKVPDTVTVHVKLDRTTRNITLKAWLGAADTPPDDKSDTLIAELRVLAAATLAPDYTPSAGRTANSSPPATATETAKTIGMKWELNWIRKGA